MVWEALKDEPSPPTSSFLWTPYAEVSFSAFLSSLLWDLRDPIVCAKDHFWSWLISSFSLWVQAARLILAVLPTWSTQGEWGSLSERSSGFTSTPQGNPELRSFYHYLVLYEYLDFLSSFNLYCLNSSACCTCAFFSAYWAAIMGNEALKCYRRLWVWYTNATTMQTTKRPQTDTEPKRTYLTISFVWLAVELADVDDVVWLCTLAIKPIAWARKRHWLLFCFVILFLISSII